MIKANKLKQMLCKCVKERTVLNINVNGSITSDVYILNFNIDTKYGDYYNLRLLLDDNSKVEILLNEKWGYISREALLRYKHKIGRAHV